VDFTQQLYLFIVLISFYIIVRASDNSFVSAEFAFFRSTTRYHEPLHLTCWNFA